ncbi:acriflavin resistance protein [Fulvitalea axinellae]|uniref:Acriflavin resistance protein n=1 Tax=Fulvitalea axinellae TaxID=1182444 RepID=A0AAU9CSB3_9BACT|nr:acriflavin resistance protein [Fulvitalea axinellae]
MNITKTALNNTRPTIGLFVILFILGLASYGSMPRDDMPPFKVRYALAITRFPGASPERMELLVTDKIEKIIQEVPEVKNITSESRTGISIVTIQLFDEVQDLQPVWDHIRRKIESVQSQLPEGVIKTEFNDEFGDVYGIMVGLTSEGFTFEEQKEYADDVRDALLELPNTGKVEIAGVINQTIYVAYDNAKLAEVGLTKERLEQIIQKSNIVSSGGSIVLGDKRIVLEPTGDYKSVEQIMQTLIPTGENGEGYVYLGDIADVYSGYDDPISEFMKIMGHQGLALAINLKKGANITTLGQEVDELTDQWNARLPYGLKLVRLTSQDLEVQRSVNNFTVNLIQSVVIVLLVMLLFLGWRTGFIVASLIPTTIVVTLFLMEKMGLGLNQITLAALIIALGMLVDNAIVVSESIMVKLEKGIDGFKAACETSKELVIPLLTSSLTTIAAFLSFYLAKSVMGELFGNLVLVVSLALLSSWLISLTLIPMLCVFFLKKKEKSDEEGDGQKGFFGKILVYYSKLQEWSLLNSRKLLTIVVGLFVAAIFGFTVLPFLFFPDSDKNLVYVNMELPLGTRIEETNKMVKKVENYLNDSLLVGPNREAGVTSFSSFLGQGAPKYDLGYTPVQSNTGSAHIIVNTTTGAVNQWVIDKLTAFIFEELPELNTFQVSRLQGGGGSAYPIEVRITGDNIDDLYQLVDQVKARLSSDPGTQNISDDWGVKTKKVVVEIDPLKVDEAGISNSDVAVSLQTTLLGTQTGQFRENDKVIPILLRNERATDVTIDELKDLNVYSQSNGSSVPLAQVARFQIDWQNPQILRRNLKRTITVRSQVKDGFTAAGIMKGVTPWLNENSKNWPLGYSYELGGEANDSKEGIGSIAKNLPISGFIILFLMLMQFNSLRKMGIVAMTIPLGLVGCVLGLLLAGSYFGFFAFLGFISMAGVIVNNAIVLIDRIAIEEKELGKPLFQAIVDAGRQRFRPILLTTFTTAFGLLPLWFDNGMWVPMAVSLIFGLLFGTFLTLVFIPVLIKIFFKAKAPEIK